MRYYLIFCCFFLSVHTVVYAQREAILEVQDDLDSLRAKMPREKVYVHTDKEQYISGDTIWYKAYAMDGETGGISALSGIVYVELFDATGALIQRSRIHSFAGSSYGEFVLDVDKVKPGRLLLRAYTHWMKNFGEEHYFMRYLDVVGDYEQQWGVKSAPIKVANSKANKQIDLSLALYPLGDKKLGRDAVSLKLVSGNEKIVAQSKALPSGSGQMDFSLTMPEKVDMANLNLVLETERDKLARFPWAQLVPQRYDVQFLPEGGHWVTDMPTVLGVKAIDGFGKGVQVKGEILDAEGKQVAHFATLHKGMGKVDFPTLPVGEYRAKVTFPDGSERSYELPKMESHGVVLHHDDEGNQDEILLSIEYVWPSEKMGRVDRLMLIGQIGGIMCYGALLKTDTKQHYIRLPRHYFPEGIVRFSVRTPEGAILSERLVYNRLRKRALSIALSPDKEHYSTKDSVALEIKVTDTLGEPVRGSFSLAVTDDGQYTLDEYKQNIWNYHYLGSDLRGYVEEPGFYYSGQEGAARAMDCLLLTQGWVRYDTPLLKQAIQYDPEPIFSIEGTVKNAFGKAVEQSNVLLLATGEQLFYADTLTDNKGHFRFQDIAPFDTAAFLVQARNRRNKSFNIGLEMKEIEAAEIPKTKIYPIKAWYVGLDSTMRRRIREQQEYQRNVSIAVNGYDANAIKLREVEVTANAVVKNSKNLNGAGGADQVLSEEVLVQEGDKDLLQIIKEKVGSFTVGYIGKGQNAKLVFKVQNRVTKLIFDGVDLDFFFEAFTGQSNEKLLFMENYLKSFSGNDVLGVEVMHSSKYSNNYHNRFLDPMERMNMGLDPPTYLEITTRSGHGPIFKKTPGVAHVRPMPFVWPKEFYRPRYEMVEGKAAYEDVRATIHWEPMVITDESGKATVTFYTSDRKGSYGVVVEGSDLQGGLGVAYGKLTVQ
ncbi:carboxypeptidase-like regulatory domain-containing protein [Olivibacter sitiensis]|uniref:carboxypeptidase-like regulatory domain-containing protein n=1 Tax=Olivibacter sitiensis TaxID=376470 RepID=UPI0003FC9E0F|nr:carboxypeptidase-like regulatory domain-containing protein [Olivibacter sitiensis]